MDSLAASMRFFVHNKFFFDNCINFQWLIGPSQNQNTMPTGYSATPLVKKLGIKPGHKIMLVDPPSAYFDWLETLPEGVSAHEHDTSEPMDFIHLFVTEAPPLPDQMLACKAKMALNGMLWVSWPKKAAKIPTTVDSNLVRNTGLGIGLVDVKVCAVSTVWSGLKFMYRLKDRK